MVSMIEDKTGRSVDLPRRPGKRLRRAAMRSLSRRCPYCGAPRIFASWFSLKKRCPVCRTLFAYEDGYFLGAYAVNLVTTELLAFGLVVWLLVATDLSVLHLQIIGVTLAVALPIILYPVALSLWMALDLVLHPPGQGSGRPRT